MSNIGVASGNEYIPLICTFVRSTSLVPPKKTEGPSVETVANNYKLTEHSFTVITVSVA